MEQENYGYDRENRAAEAEEKMKAAVNYSTEPKKKKGSKAIASLLLSSFIGGIVGGVVGMNLATPNNTLTIPRDSAPIEVVAGDISPVVAIAEVVSPSIVGIKTYGMVQDWFGRQYTSQLGGGSGIIFRNDGYIITNNHVVEGATGIEVSLYNGESYQAEIIGVDSATDLAVIKIEAPDLAAAVLGDSDELRIGELAVAIGNPLGYSNTVTSGIISGLNRQSMSGYEQELSLIQTDAAINSGNSGGALVNSNGEVIGINSVKLASGSVEGMGFAITINEAKPIIEQLLNQGHVSRPYMGIGVQEITEVLAKQYQLSQKHGIIITQIVENGPADKAGLRLGDIIYKANDVLIYKFTDFSDLLDASQVGDSIHLLIDRNGKQMEIFVTLGDKGKA
ncbi:MAG: trypsin-like peptidase domain-containing protein [Peptococcaceae bacterium]|nr:trypsin-like peptidase domain-containing protein [Peptococcaceae bacterium]